MKKILVLLLALSMLFALCACGGAENGADVKDNAGTENAAADSDEAIISIEVLDAGFCKATSMGYSKNETTTTKNGVTTKKIHYNIFDYDVDEVSEGEDKILFVIQANITNISDGSIIIDEQLEGTVDFKGMKEAGIYTHAFQYISSVNYNTIRSGESTPAVLVCFLDGDYADNFKGCSVFVGGVTLDFNKDEIEIKDRIAFTPPEDVETVSN